MTAVHRESARWTHPLAGLFSTYPPRVLGVWTVDGTDQFVWIISYDGAKSWEQANSDSYQSPQRKALDSDPARHLAQTQTRLMTAV